MRHCHHLNLALFAFALSSFGCESTKPKDAVHVTLAPVALDRQLVLVDGEDQHAYLLDVGKARTDADARRLELPPGANLTQRRAAHDEALILCAGERGSQEVDAEPSALVAIDNSGRRRSFELGTTPFNALVQSDDGRYAVLYQSGAGQGRTLSNPNEMVVVDLDADPDDDGAVTGKTPDGLGHPLNRVLISPSLRIAEEDRRLLVVLSAAEVTLFDLNHLDRRATIVQLDETRTVDPVQVLFAADAPSPSMFVRAESSDNIFMLRFEAHDNDPQGNDFRPAINLISGGGGPRDIAVYGTGSDTRLLIAAETSSQALVVDPSSSKSIALKLSAPAQRILLFQASSPSDTETRTRALLYAPKSSSVTFLDLEGLSDAPDEKLELVPVAQPIAGVIPLLDAGQVVLLHERAVTLLGLAEHTLTPILSSQPISADPVFDQEHGRLWIGVGGQPWLGTLDLGTGKTDEVLLDASIDGLVPMFTAQRLVVLHASDIGYLTVLDLDHPSRKDAQELNGFYISGGLSLSR